MTTTFADLFQMKADYAATFQRDGWRRMACVDGSGKPAGAVGKPAGAIDKPAGAVDKPAGVVGKTLASYEIKKVGRCCGLEGSGGALT